MATSPTTTNLLTAKEFMAIPDDGCRLELIAGKVARRRYAWWNEGLAGTKICLSLSDYVVQNDLGVALSAGVGYHIKSSPDHVRVPSVGFISRERTNVEDPEAYFPGAPDIAVECVTTCDTYYYVTDKVSDWLEAGAGMVVVVDAHNKSVMAHRSHTDVAFLKEADTLDGGDVLPGWRMTVADIFA